MEPAGFGRRYLAFLLDILFLEILGAVVNAPLVTDLGAESGRVLVEWAEAAVPGGFTGRVAGPLLLLAALWSWYFTCFHWLAGRTPGKKLSGLWVRHKDGRSLGPVTALVRFWAALVLGLLTLGLGYAWAGWDPWRQAWHDKLFDTVVIRKSTS